jgi:D-3-phosphoglycerate dehydrogenase / 2-oxoglutarate reductase
LKALIRAPFHEDGIRMIRQHMEVEIYQSSTPRLRLTESELIDHLKGIDLIILELDNLTETVIESANSLKMIACCRANPVNVDIKAATRRKIPIFTAPGRNAISVAEFTIGLMISLARRIVSAHIDLKSGGWGRDAQSPYVKFQGFELLGKTIGLIGMGRVAQEVAQRLSSFGVHVVYSDPYISEDRVRDLRVTRMELRDLLRVSDIVSIHCELTPQTEGMIGKEQLSQMKPSAYLINTARGKIIVEKDLIEAVEEGWIAGAALDVYAEEPFTPDNPLNNRTNILITPHIAGATKDVVRHHSVIIAEDIERFLTGKKPLHVWNSEVL